MPFQWYADLVAHPPNAALRESLDVLIGREAAGDLAPRELRDLVAAVQDAFLAAEFPPRQLETIRARVDGLGVKKLKVRSSANAEDIPGFDGAGLHDSYSVKTKIKDLSGQVCIVNEEQDDGGESKAVHHEDGEVVRRHVPDEPRDDGVADSMRGGARPCAESAPTATLCE